ncbi:MAG: 4-alpha-glucanotransferase [Nitrospira sp.]|nr:4-alpha-glucanotransferase [Nitrospira sp.]MDH4370809.1 4-alpha-glucanotransferase [Nitrospira sp.]MDH5498602.1 4-alpha-glucanotransferase [Nitrospira sp.]MDH5725491.1 4-alpha-glucanotransferase [Nitrospira sp.]
MYDQSESDLLRTLADRAGIVADYYDIAGACHATTDETRRAILSAMDLRVTNREELIEELTAWDNRPWLRGCQPIHVIRVGREAGTWSLYVPCESSEEASLHVLWTLYAEGGEKQYEQAEGSGLRIEETRTIQGRRFVRVTLAFPSDLPLGYYWAKSSVKGGGTNNEASFRLIVAPERCYIPAQLQQGARWWGIALQLYSLRSDRNWGIGDFGDLASVVEWTGQQLGAAVIGLNPLHALKNTKPYHISPYSPTSRLFLNDLYIDVEQVLEYRTAPEVQARLADVSVCARIEAARGGEFVDYDAVGSVKREMLELCYRAFLREHFDGEEPELKPTTERGWNFHRFTEREGESLTSYALFQALEESRRAEQGISVTWADWPEPYRIPTSEAVGEFRRRHMQRVRFFQYLQWLAADQLLALVRKTHEAGMPIGFYHDLALGSDRYGADGWRSQEVLALHADCGAPPDAFAPEGQNWGFSPLDPLRLRASGYQYVIELLRKNLRYGGAIRLDHVMALFRLFWIPRGLPASMGTYVHYRDEELLAILALESVRAKALVIGEDLGTVPDWVRDRLEATGVLSYRVLYFERAHAGTWKPPAHYPAQALAVVTTHDLATLSGYWEGADIEARSTLGLFPSEQARTAMLSGRQGEKAGILAALKSEGLLPPGVSDDPAQVPTMTSELTEAVHQYLARSPAWMVLANIEDIIGTRAQANLPGTLDQHPNWCRKLGPTIKELTQDSRFERLAAQLRVIRPPV